MAGFGEVLFEKKLQEGTLDELAIEKPNPDLAAPPETQPGDQPPAEGGEPAPSVETPEELAAKQEAANKELQSRKDWLKNELGTDDVTSVKEKLTTYEALQAENSKLKSEMPDYSPAEIALINYKRSGKDIVKFDRLQKADPNTLSTADLLKLKLSWENPDSTDRGLDVVIKRQYGIGLTQDEKDAMEDDDLVILEDNLSKATREAKEWVNTTKAKEAEGVLPKSNEQKQKEANDVAEKKRATDEYAANFVKNRDEAAQALKEINVKIDDKNTYKYDVTPDDATKVSTTVAAKFKSGNDEYYAIPANAFENEADLIKTIFKGRNFDQITEGFVIDAQKTADKLAAAKYNNVQPLVGDQSKVLNQEGNGLKKGLTEFFDARKG